MATVAAIEFSADRTAIRPGECVTFTWKVEGVKEVYFFADGENWQDHGVVGVSQQEVCPSHTTNYNLRVVQRDNKVRERAIQIVVDPIVFTVDRTTIRPGECVTFRWHVEGVKEVYFHREDLGWEGRGVVGVSEAERCPPETHTFCLRIVNRDDSVTVRKFKITVSDSAPTGRPENPIPL